MTKSTRTLGVGLGLWALALVGAASIAVAAPVEAEATHESVVVTGIDRTTRSVTLQNADGETKTVQVPADVKAYDTLKVGDHVDIDYYEAMAVSLLPAGAKPSVSESSSMNRMGHGVGTGTRETSISATVIAVDTRNNKVTFKGPQGKTRTVAVSDPDMQKKLPSLKVGQVVQVTYTEAIAVSLRPTSPASSKMNP